MLSLFSKPQYAAIQSYLSIQYLGPVQDITTATDPLPVPLLKATVKKCIENIHAPLRMNSFNYELLFYAILKPKFQLCT